MKELKYGAFIFCLVLCCVFTGYYLGYCEANDITISEALAEGAVKQEQEIAYNKTIAIVNMDEGIVKNDNTINYAVELIDTITDDVMVTGLEDARRGIESGTYSAYLMIPAAFSENVVSVTTKPVKSQLSYALGTELRGNERDEVLQRMEAIFQLFSDNLSKVYLSSILEEYHDAQDSASTIMTNDTEDMELLLAVEGEDLIEIIEIPEVTEVENEIEDLDLSDNYAKTEENAKNIDEAYRKYYEEGKTVLTEIQDSFQNTEEQISNIATSLGTTNEAAQNAAGSVWDDTQQTATEDAAYQELKDALTGTIDDQGQGTEGLLVIYNRELESRIEKQVAAGIKNRTEGLLTGFMAALETDIGSLTFPEGETKETYINSYMEKLYPPEPEEGDGEGDENISTANTGDGENETLDEPQELAGVNIKEVNDQIDLLITAAKDGRDKRNQAIREKEQSLSSLYSQTQALVTSYDEMKTSYEENHTELAAFDMATYIDEAEINSYLTDIEDSLYNVEEKVEEQIVSYETYVETVYETTQEDIEKFEESIIEAQEISELKLTEGLAAAKESRAKSNETNLLLLDTFKERLPYTRLGEVENKEVYDFIAAPIVRDNRSEAQKEIEETKSPGMGLAITIVVLTGILVLSGSIYLIGQKKKNKVTTVQAQEVIETSYKERRT